MITNSPAVSSEESGLSERLDGSPGERWTLDAARRLGHVAEQWLMISSGIRPPNTWGLDSQRKKMVGNVRVWEVLYYNIQVIRIPKMWEMLFTNQYKRDDIGFLTIQWSGVVAMAMVPYSQQSQQSQHSQHSQREPRELLAMKI